ncbi:MAG: hypothetical protein O7A09_11645 [Proteobacteria bacterium]|nr:hypothetical protein [Pseudomonadota bacterium]
METSQPDRGRRALRVVGAAAGLYLLGFLIFYPAVPGVRDSVRYLEQAYAFSLGITCFEKIDPVEGDRRCARPAQYLPGTAATMAPFVWLFGWRGGYLVSALSLAAALWITALWLRGQRRSPLFALMLLGYPSALVFGRIAMSDMPSTALAALGLWLFWTRRGGVGRSLLTGLVAAVALQFRETNALVFFVLFAGAVLRRETAVWALVAGGGVGLLLRPLGTWVVFGDPLFVFPYGPEFSLGNLPSNLPLYALTLLVFQPGGALGMLLYRGDRRPEVILTLVIFLSVYLTYGYTGAESGAVKQLLLGPRYFMPLTPLIAFACAESFPRGLAWLESRLDPARRERLGRGCTLAVRTWAAGILAAAFLVHPAYSAYNAPYRGVQEAIYEYSAEGSVVVYNSRGVRKFVNRLFGGRQFARRKLLDDDDIVTLLERHGGFTLALLDRSGSETLGEESALNREFEERTRALADMELLQEMPVGAGDHLRIWRVTPRR